LLVKSLTLILSLHALGACSQQTIPNNQSNSGAQPTSSNTQIIAPGEAPGFSNAPVVAPPSYNGLPALKPLKGVNVNNLFAENISNSDKRFERLENAVVDMRREFEAVKPAIVRLVAVEEDIQQMVEQLESMALQEQRRPAPTAPVYREPSAAPQPLTPTDIQNPTPAPTSVTRPMEPKPQAAAPAPNNTSAASGPTVKNLRTGRHSNKTRLVLDMSAKTPYTVDLDSSENLLVIELPQASWSGATSKNFSAREPLLASYSVESINNGQGTRIIMPLKKSTRITKQDLLPPGVTPNYRMYVDLSL